MTVSKGSDSKMTAFIQVCLWLFLLDRICEIILPIAEVMKHRRKLRRIIKFNLRQYENAASDCWAGYFYGKAKLYEKELKETRYFDYD